MQPPGLCPICKGSQFRPGPNGRLSRKGRPPVCAGCGSLERHRILRIIAEPLRDRERFLGFRALFLNREPILPKGWFASVEVEGPDAAAVLDGAAPQLEGHFGLILCAHVLPRLPDHRAAVARMARALSPEGLLLLTYPSPVTRPATTDWGFADPKQHGHFRVLGRDFEAEYARITPDAFVFAVLATDPVTGDDDLAYVLTRSFYWPRRAAAVGLNSRLL